MSGYSIQSSQKINCSSVWCFLHLNFWHFEFFAFLVFELTVQLLPFRLVRFLTNNSFYTFEASTRCWVEILRLVPDQYLAKSKNTSYFIEYSYLQPI